MSQNLSYNLLALDIGDSKIGVARASVVAKIPQPLAKIANDENLLENLKKLTEEYQANTIIVGVPRNMSGEETEQSKKIRNQVSNLKTKLKDINFIFVDESLSSVRAGDYIKVNNSRADEDSISACYILEEYFTINK